jgi:hypothetical protein
MKITITIPDKVYNEIKHHLLPQNQKFEEAAFVYSSVNVLGRQMELNYLEWYAIKPKDYLSRSAYHFELTHEMNSRIIKRAHDLNSSIIELHSHLDHKPVRFSYTDWQGFSEFVPHVLWRIKNKPYSAIVITKQGIDALIWVESFNKPLGLNELIIGNEKIIPSNYSLNYHDNEY